MTQDINPYQVPQADITPEPAPGYHQPRSCPAGRGVAWILEAWSLYRMSPLLWIVALLWMVTFLILASFIPFASTLLMPVVSAGVYEMVRQATLTGTVEARNLFEGFRQRLGPLIILGVLSTLLTLLCVVPAGLVMGLTLNLTNPLDSLSLETLLVFSAVLGLAFIPLIMATWFAPLLVMFENLSPTSALKTSFRACLANIWPMTVYGLVMPLVLIIGLLALGVGLLVAIPLLWLSVYTAYHDIFISQD